MSDEPTKRFSSRVDDYVKYRPTYPTAVLDCLKEECGLTDTAVIADIGSGTGLLSKLFLDNGNTVYGVEPNEAMRLAGETYLADYGNFTSMAATAEATTLAADSVDFVVAGQAAHWFEAKPARAEFLRILKAGGTIALVWNTRDVTGSDFMQAYEHILVDFARTDTLRPARTGGHERDPDYILGEAVKRRTFSNQKLCDYEALQGLTLSSSMSPLVGDPKHEPMLAALRQLFNDFQVDGRVYVLYLTELYYSH